MDDQLQSLIILLEGTDAFDSINNMRILSVLISYPEKLSAKEIGDIIDLPDSKVYPALSELEELSLIYVDYSKRPKLFSFIDPPGLIKFMKEHVEQKYKEKLQLLDEIKKLTYELWDADEYRLGNIARIFRDQDIDRELLRILKTTKEHIFLLLSPTSSQFIPMIYEELSKILKDDIRVDIAIPVIKEAERLIEFKEHPLVSVKTSIWNGGSSYIIRDRSIMLNIMHQDEGNVGLLTNDELMLKNITTCWTDTECCAPSEQLIELETMNN